MIFTNRYFLNLASAAVLLCDFYREQAWEWWLNTKSNGCSDIKGFILPLMRNIAKSLDIETMDKAISVLKESEWWWDDHEKFKEYFTKYWLDKKEV